MKKIKLAYYYLFYRFYLFCEIPPAEGDSDWKAASFIAVLEIFVFFSGYIYYKMYFNRSSMLEITSPLFVIPMGIIFVLKYLVFLRNDAWVDYYEKFDKWPYEKNRRGGIRVLCVIGVILIGFSSAIYLFTKSKGL